MRRNRCLAAGPVLLAALAVAAGTARGAGDDDPPPFGATPASNRDASWEAQIAQARAARAAQPSSAAPASPPSAPAAPTTPAVPRTPAAAPPVATPPATTTPGAVSLAPTPPATVPATAPATGFLANVGNVGSALEATTFVPPIMLGDQAPFTIPVPQSPATPNPLHPPVPGLPGSPRQGRSVASLAPWIRGFKIAEDQSPRPQDRFFFNFNYYNNLNYETNARLGSPIRDLQAYREIFGFEKTIFDGNASLGFRLPIDSLTGVSSLRGYGTGSTSVGSLMMFSKVVLWQDAQRRNLISGGFAFSVPTGPTTFSGANHNVTGFRDMQLQPYLGYIWTKGKFFVQGFEEIEVPTDSHDVTMLYTDVGLGYYVYSARDPKALLKAIVPTFETHVNVPLNHRGALRFNDPAGTADVVDFTFGTNFLLGPRSILSFALVEPVTGPRPFNFEWNVTFNLFFGKGQTSYRIPPPVVGQ